MITATTISNQSQWSPESVANDHISRSALGHPVGHSGPCYRHGETEHKLRKSLWP